MYHKYSYKREAEGDFAMAGETGVACCEDGRSTSERIQMETAKARKQTLPQQSPEETSPADTLTSAQ